MNNYDKSLVTQLEDMPFNEARDKIATGKLGAIGSPQHAFCSSWLGAKEAALRDTREEETLRIAHKANKMAVFAIILGTISAGVALLQGCFL